MILMPGHTGYSVLFVLFFSCILLFFVSSETYSKTFMDFVYALANREITNESQKGFLHRHQLSKNDSIICSVCMMNGTTCISVLRERVLMANDWNLSASD